MYSIEQIRHEVTWPLRHEVMYPDMDLESVKLPDDDQGIHFGLFDHNRLISIISTFKTGDEMQFRKFATLNEFQGQGYGAKLFDYVLEFAKSEDIKRIWMNARVNVSAFYERYGFIKTEKTYFKDGYDFVIMEKIV